MPVIGPGRFQQCEKMERPSASLLSSQGHDVERRMCCICYRALRPITAHPAACCAEVGCEMLRSVVSTLDYVLGEINQIIRLYAMKVEIYPASLASMYPLSFVECFMFPFCHYQRHNTFIA